MNLVLIKVVIGHTHPLLYSTIKSINIQPASAFTRLCFRGFHYCIIKCPIFTGHFASHSAANLYSASRRFFHLSVQLHASLANVEAQKFSN